MSRKERTLVVGVGLLIAAVIFPLVELMSGLQDWVAQTAVKAGNEPKTHYGEIGLKVYIAIWLIGAVVGVWWIFNPAKQAPNKNSN